MRSVAVNASRLALAGEVSRQLRGAGGQRGRGRGCALYMQSKVTGVGSTLARTGHRVLSAVAEPTPLHPSPFRRCAAAVKNGLHTHLRHQSPRLFTHITGKQQRGRGRRNAGADIGRGGGTQSLPASCLVSLSINVCCALRCTGKVCIVVHPLAPPPCLPVCAAFVQEWVDRVQDAAEVGAGQQRGGAAARQEGGAAAPDSDTAAAQEAVLRRHPFGFTHIQAPKARSCRHCCRRQSCEC